MNESIVHAIESANKVFLDGPFGTGKTSLAIHRLQWLLRQERVHGSQILVLTSQRTLGKPYIAALKQPGLPPGSSVNVTTFASLARQSTELYWPLLSNDAGFAHPGREPSFLNLETSQYHMGPLVDDALRSGAFDGMRVERNRVISQILDNMNKAALNGFTIDDAYSRLENSVAAGEHRTASLNALLSAKEVSLEFRQLCLESNLVDFSLQISLFNMYILNEEWSRTHLMRSYRHMIVDNLEEDTHSAHQLVARWLPHVDSALLITDSDGGLRAFLGASPDGADRLRAKCDRTVQLTKSLTMTKPVLILERSMHHLIRRRADSGAANAPVDNIALTSDSETVTPALYMPESSFRFYPQMIQWVAEQIEHLTKNEGVAAEEIVILAPYMSDALKFGLQTELAERGVSTTTHRPSRSLRSEPAARSLLTLAALAHPQWRIDLSHADVAAMLSTALTDADPVRASLLASGVFRPRGGAPELGLFQDLAPAMQKRITYRLGEKYDWLREWLVEYQVQPDVVELDHFWSRLFGELLSQPGYSFHQDMDAARSAHQLITAARNFRWAVDATIDSVGNSGDSGREFYHLVDSGAVGALYPGSWRERDNAVLIAPAYTFLMRNRAVGYQFWLDIGSSGWWERLYQPLTHPYVLSSEWPPGKLWSDYDENLSRQRSLRRLVLGLMRRSKQGVYLGLTQFSESGYEQQGALLTFINRLIASGQIALLKV